MYGPHHLKDMVDRRHEEALQQARTRRLAKQARAAPREQGSSRVGLVLRAPRALPRQVEPWQ